MLDIASLSLPAYFAIMVAVMSILSIPLAPPTLIAVKTSTPAEVALCAAVAAACAAVFDYHFIRRAFQMEALDRLRRHWLFTRAQRWAAVAPFWTTAAFAALPLPFIIVRVLVPLSGYPLKRYAPAVALGRFPRIYVIATFGTIVEIPNNILVGLLIAGVVASAAGAVIRHLRARSALQRGKGGVPTHVD